MYIEPNSVVKLLKNCPLDPTYQHTIYFNSKEDQYDYFNSLAKHRLSKMYFQRPSRGYTRVSIPIGELYDCNYMMFQNEDFSDKWFYAFILGVEYIGNKTTEIRFMLDPLQTWFFDYEIKQSFVLREHSQTDVAGDNIVPETVRSDIQFINSVTEEQITVVENYILASTVPEWIPASPDEEAHWEYKPVTTQDIRSGILMPYKQDAVVADAPGTPQDLEAKLQPYCTAGQMDGILGVQPRYRPVTVSLARPANINGYIPRNKKLLTGQYCRFTFELAGNTMEIPLDVVSNPVVTSEPRGAVGFYQLGLGAYRVYLANYANAVCPSSMSIEIPVECIKWAFNDYANKTALQSEATAMMLSREKLHYEQDLMNNVAEGAKATAKVAELSTPSAANLAKWASNPMSQVGRGIEAGQQAANAVMGGIELLTNIDEHSEAISRHHANMRAPATGASIATNTLISQGQLWLSGYVWTVLREDAERIDKYFDMYGYAVNQMKIPNRNFRPHWNYVQTSGLEAVFNCPQDDAQFIKSIYEKGITFWNNGNEVGDYSLDNSI